METFFSPTESKRGVHHQRHDMWMRPTKKRRMGWLEAPYRCWDSNEISNCCEQSKDNFLCLILCIFGFMLIVGNNYCSIVLKFNIKRCISLSYKKSLLVFKNPTMVEAKEDSTHCTRSSMCVLLEWVFLRLIFTPILCFIKT